MEDEQFYKVSKRIYEKTIYAERVAMRGFIIAFHVVVVASFFAFLSGEIWAFLNGVVIAASLLGMAFMSNYRINTAKRGLYSVNQQLETRHHDK